MSTSAGRSRFGTQPAHALLSGRYGGLRDAAAHLGVKVPTLRAYLTGRNLAPAEVKIGLAEHLGVAVDQCWTPAALAATYGGPRNGTDRP